MGVLCHGFRWLPEALLARILQSPARVPIVAVLSVVLVTSSLREALASRAWPHRTGPDACRVLSSLRCPLVESVLVPCLHLLVHASSPALSPLMRHGWKPSFFLMTLSLISARLLQQRSNVRSRNASAFGAKVSTVHCRRGSLRRGLKSVLLLHPWVECSDGPAQLGRSSRELLLVFLSHRFEAFLKDNVVVVLGNVVYKSVVLSKEGNELGAGLVVGKVLGLDTFRF